MNSVAIIPARMESSRFPNKPMKKILGMPMIGHCYQRTQLSQRLQATYVATCNEEIFDYIESIGGKAVMTSSAHTRATSRTAEAIKIIENDQQQNIDVVLMVQGDEPLIHHKVVDHLLSQFTDNTIHVANVMSQLKTDSAFKDKNNIKVVIDQDDNALYFSREPIPSHWSSDHVVPRYMQTGVIAFRRNALLNFNNMEETPLEQIESIDMNRILETGGRIKMVLTDLPIIGVDTPNDLIEANRLMETDALVEFYI